MDSNLFPVRPIPCRYVRPLGYGDTMRDLFIYHPGTGTMIPLSDPVFLIDAGIIEKKAPGSLESYEDGYATHDDAELMGYRLDNENMTRLFFGVL